MGDTYTWVPEEGFLGDDKFGAISWLNIAKVTFFMLMLNFLFVFLVFANR